MITFFFSAFILSSCASAFLYCEVVDLEDRMDAAADDVAYWQSIAQTAYAEIDSIREELDL